MNEKAKEEEELIWLPKSLCERMSSLSKWSLEDLLKVIEKINSYNQNTKDIIQFLFENYRIKEKP